MTWIELELQMQSIEEGPDWSSFFYLLGLFNCFRHRQEHAVQENSRHHDVIKELVGGHSNTSSPPRIPGFEEEAALGARKPVDVVLAEPLRDDAEGLKR